MTKYQILLALYRLLEDEFRSDSSRSEGYIGYLSGLDPYLWTDGNTADPACYADFMEITENVPESDSISAEAAYAIAEDYLTELCSREKADGNDISEVLTVLRSCDADRWSDIVAALTANATKKYKCPCCGCYTMDQPNGSYEICEVCFWEDDRVQNNDPDLAGGANAVCLREARENYKKYGACDERSVPFTRLPTAEELSGIVQSDED